MPDRIHDIKGMSPEHAGTLEQQGIRNTDHLREQTKTPQQRRDLAKKTGISEQQLTEYMNRGDLMRLKGVGTEMANLLEEVGVDSVKELRHRRAENLHQRMQDVNGEKHIVQRPPTLAQVQQWIEEAKSMDVS